MRRERSEDKPVKERDRAAARGIRSKDLNLDGTLRTGKKKPRFAFVRKKKNKV